jgi:hypothetical protein
MRSAATPESSSGFGSRPGSAAAGPVKSRPGRGLAERVVDRGLGGDLLSFQLTDPSSFCALRGSLSVSLVRIPSS